MRNISPTGGMEFASAKWAFFHRIGGWSDALENGDLDHAQMELRHMEILSERLLQDPLFKDAAAKQNAQPEDLVNCLNAYLRAITESMPYSAAGDEKGADESSEPD
jgi:hypothetical protein